MKFSVLQEHLSKGINIVSRAVPTKAALPILSNILLSAEDGRLKLAATNMETTIVTYVGASVDQEGKITVPGKILKELVGTISPSTIKAKLEKDTLHLESDKTKTKINGINAEDYPELPEFKKKEKFLELDPKEFNNAISLVYFASGTDETRPVFTGILIKKDGNKMIIASTDGYRLSEKTLNLNETKYNDFTVIIPTKTLVEVARILSGSSEPVQFAIHEDENLALFVSEDTFIATRILDGEYPDYNKIVPKDSSLSAFIPFEDFVEAVRLTKVFATEEDSAIIIKFSSDNIKITSLSEMTGEHESNINAEIEGDPLEIAFGTKYLLDYLSNIKGPRIHFSATGNTSPCVLKVEEHENYFHIIMPRQI